MSHKAHIFALHFHLAKSLKLPYQFMSTAWRLPDHCIAWRLTKSCLTTCLTTTKCAGWRKLNKYSLNLKKILRWRILFNSARYARQILLLRSIPELATLMIQIQMSFTYNYWSRWIEVVEFFFYVCFFVENVTKNIEGSFASPVK